MVNLNNHDTNIILRKRQFFHLFASSGVRIDLYSHFRVLQPFDIPNLTMVREETGCHWEFVPPENDVGMTLIVTWAKFTSRSQVNLAWLLGNHLRSREQLPIRITS